MSYGFGHGHVVSRTDFENEISVDVTDPETVQISIARDGRTAWINLNGKCLLRLSRIVEISVEDDRNHSEEDSEGG